MRLGRSWRWGEEAARSHLRGIRKCSQGSYSALSPGARLYQRCRDSLSLWGAQGGSPWGRGTTPGAPKDPPSPCPWTRAPHEASLHWTVGMSSTEPGNSGCINLQPETAHLLGLRDTSESSTQGHRQFQGQWRKCFRLSLSS